MNTSGYSGTPLAKKLGLKPGFKVKILNHPAEYFSLFPDLPDDLIEISNPKTKADFIHYFYKESKELESDLHALKNQITQHGMIWISWPKKASKVKTDLDGNVVRRIGLDAGLVDVKVCSINETWSGLKFVIPVKDRVK